MTVAELLQAIGNDRVAVQYLDQCAIDLNWTELSGCRIKFGSDVRLTPKGTEKLGIVVWLDRDDVKRAIGGRS